MLRYISPLTKVLRIVIALVNNVNPDPELGPYLVLERAGSRLIGSIRKYVSSKAPSIERRADSSKVRFGDPGGVLYYSIVLVEGIPKR